MTPQKKATVVSTSVAAILTIIKLIVGIASGSVALLASAIDSVLDMFVSIFNFFAISNAEKPADKNFNYGRGKTEALASLIEGVIITASGLFLLYHALQKAIKGSQSQHLDISIIVMIISLIITICLVMYLNNVAKKTKSLVIKADALHYKTDVYSNIAVLASLILVNIFELEIIDIIIGSSIAIYIIYSAFELIKDGYLILLDSALENKQVENIKDIITKHPKATSYHLLKTRQAAKENFVEFHLVLNAKISLLEAHKISHEIEDKIKNIDNDKNWHINIHLDPYDDLKDDLN